MKRNLSVAIAIATLAPAVSFADVTVYGKVNVAFEPVTNVGDASYSSLVNNASRFGLKGSEEISATLKAIYQFEYEADVDGTTGDSLGKRNIFVGLEGDFGQVIAGYFDTPTKSAQGKVDLFNDLRGDIKYVITKNDKRGKNAVMYSTPSMSGFTASAAYISSEIDDQDPGLSASLVFSNDMLYAALAYDQDVTAVDSDTLRLVLQGTVGALQVGVLYEQYDADSLADSVEGTLVSGQYNLSDKMALKAQFGSSEQQHSEGATTASIGLDYKYTKNFKTFVYYTLETFDDIPGATPADAVTVTEDNDYLGVGVELKF